MFKERTIVVGVTGAIAAYKTAGLVSALAQKGAQVHVIMTWHATEFVTPLTYATLSGNPVHCEMFTPPAGWTAEHIRLADVADLLAVVPATANIMGKVAAGVADDLLSTTIMACRAPVLLAPSMNCHMYENKVVQRNISTLRELGYHILEPEEGHLACGYEGKGRLPKLEVILERLQELLSHRRADNRP